LALRLAARIRSGGICEKCKKNRAAHLHHLTYRRLGHEDLADLQDVCLPCHQSCHPDHEIGVFAPETAVAPKRTFPLRRGPKQKKVKKPQKPRPVEPYWDEINGTAYAKQVARKTFRAGLDPRTVRAPVGSKDTCFLCGKQSTDVVFRSAGMPLSGWYCLRCVPSRKSAKDFQKCVLCGYQSNTKRLFRENGEWKCRNSQMCRRRTK
jgi:hypothetical protein